MCLDSIIMWNTIHVFNCIDICPLTNYDFHSVAVVLDSIFPNSVLWGDVDSECSKETFQHPYILEKHTVIFWTI